MMDRAQNINPRMLLWARETAGLSIEEAAGKLKITDSTRGTAVEKLTALESGQDKPTRIQLVKIASIYRRPLTVFYMNAAPVVAERGEDFRTLPGPVTSQEAALLDALLRDVRARHAMIRSIIDSEDAPTRRTFVGSISRTISARSAAAMIKAALHVEDDRTLRRGNSAPDDLFADLRSRAEGIGIFVVLAGNLGTHHTNISEAVFRGFAIADDLAPLIVINDQDAKAARSFTLVHEIAHIFLGSTGISGAPDFGQPTSTKLQIERFCNDVAGEFLLPEAILPAVDRMASANEMLGVISQAAAERKVSEASLAYRLWRTGRISDDSYRELVAIFSARWQAFKQREKEKKAPDDRSGPSYYTVKKFRLGEALVRFVGHALRAEELSHTKAAKLLGVKVGSVEPMLAGVPGLGSAMPERAG